MSYLALSRDIYLQAFSLQLPFRLRLSPSPTLLQGTHAPIASILLDSDLKSYSTLSRALGTNDVCQRWSKRDLCTPAVTVTFKNRHTSITQANAEYATIQQLALSGGGSLFGTSSPAP